tara:strand:- start:605 stop:862 length:258 start_codon:yes stop_codon:yes gene_type:complete
MNNMPQFHELFLFLVMMMTGVIMGIIQRVDNNNNNQVSVRVQIIWVVISVWGIFFAQYAFCIDLFIFMNTVTFGWLICPLLGYGV